MSAQAIYITHFLGFVAGVFLLMRPVAADDERWEWRLAGKLAVIAAMALFLLVKSETHWILHDFRVAYYSAGVAIQDGPQGLALEIERGVEGFVNLPIVAYLFWPFGALSDQVASLLHAVFGLVCILAAWWLLVRLLSLGQQQALLLLFIFAANGPIVYSFKEGNLSHMLLLLFVVAFIWLRNGRQFGAGILLGLAALIKPPLLALGAYFLFRRNWRVVAGGALFCTLAVALSVVIFGWEMHLRWYELCIKPFGKNPMGAYNVQSIPAFLLRLQLGPENKLFVWKTHSLGVPFAVLSGLLVAAIWISVLWVLLRSSMRMAIGKQPAPLATELEFMMVIAAICVTSPVSWSHYYSWFLLPAAFFVSNQIVAWRKTVFRYIGWIGLLLLATPVLRIYWRNEWLYLAYTYVGVSLMLAGGLIWFALLGIARYRLVQRSDVVAPHSHFPNGDLPAREFVPVSNRQLQHE